MMARFVLSASLRRCVAPHMRCASDELGGLGKGGGDGSAKDAGGSPPKGDKSPEEREAVPDYVDYIRRYHSEEIGHHYGQIAFLQTSIERHRNKIRKLLFED